MTQDQFLGYSAMEFQRTRRLAAAFTDADLDYRPTPEIMSAGEQFAHIIGGQKFIASLMAGKTPDHTLFQTEAPSQVSQILEGLDQASAQVQEAVRGCDDASWQESVSPFGPHFTLPRGIMAVALVEHEIHHRGNLYVYARLCGHTPPPLYEPPTE